MSPEHIGDDPSSSRKKDVINLTESFIEVQVLQRFGVDYGAILLFCHEIFEPAVMTNRPMFQPFDVVDLVPVGCKRLHIDPFG